MINSILRYLPGPYDLAIAVIAVGAFQLLLALRFAWRMARDRDSPSSGSLPFVSVIVPCKDVGPEYERNARSLIGQDYGGRREFLFVAQSKEDPAYAELSRILKGRDDCRVLASEEKPEVCSGQILNVLCGVNNASPQAQVFLFADSDIQPPGDWLRRMSSPLRDSRTGATTTLALGLPRASSPGASLRAALMCAGAPFFDWMGNVSGQAMALRRSDFENWGVAEVWSRSVSHDLHLSGLLAERAVKVRFVYSAVLRSPEDCGFLEAVGGFGKWMKLYRVYLPGMWLAAGLASSVKVFAYNWCTTPPLADLDLLGLLLLFEFASLGAVLAAVRGVFLRRGEPPCAGGALAVWAWSLLLPLVQNFNFGVSLFSEGFAWSGYWYRLRGPSDVIATEGGRPPRRRVGSVFAPYLLLAFSGAVLGAGHWPAGPWWTSFLAYVPLFWLLRDAAVGRALLYGWVFGTAVWASGACWLPEPMAPFMGISAAAASILSGWVYAYHGLRWGMAALAVAALSSVLRTRFRDGGGWAYCVSLSAALVVSERFYPALLPDGFADILAGHLPAVQSVELFGPSAAAWLALGVNAALFLVAADFAAGRGLRLKPLLLAAMALTLNEAYGTLRIAELEASLPASARVGIGLVQGALETPYRFSEAPAAEYLAVHNELTERALKQGPPDLVVWPESAYPRRLDLPWRGSPSRPMIAGEDASDVLRREIPHAAEILVNARATRGRWDYNIALLKGGEGEVRGIVEKSLLFPFGEYMPYGRRFPWLRSLSPNTDRLFSGRHRAPVTGANGVRYGVLICREDAVSDSAARAVRAGADVLVNMTNDAGLRHPSAAYQHLRSSRLRAVETRRALVRAVNDGVSAVISPTGKVERFLTAGERGFLAAEVPLLQGRTPYVRFGDLGLLAAGCWLLWLLYLAFLRGRAP